jgi:hypothetical protein
MNLFERLVTQQTVDDHNPWNLELDRLVTGCLEYESSLISKPAIQKGVYEPLDIFARVCNVSNGIERVGRRGRRTLVWFLIRVMSQKLPFDVWKLPLERTPCKL